MKKLVIALTMLAAGQAALAQPWSFTKIVDSKTVIPGSTEKFDGATSFQYVSVYADRVAFLGQAKSGNGYGVYEWQSGVGRTIANKNTVVPGGNTKIQVYHEINATSRGVTFYAAAPDNSGVFYEDGTSLGHVADRMDSIPDGNGKFTGIEFRHHSVGTSTAFAGRNDASGQPFGIYRSDDGVLSRIADKTMSPPNRSDLFSFFGEGRLSGNTTCFTGGTASGYQGIIRHEGGVLTTLVDNTMSLPNGKMISSLGDVRPYQSEIAFQAYGGPDHQYIARKAGDSIEVLVDALADPPGPSESFNGINEIDYQNGVLIFGANDYAIYTNYGGELQRVVGPGDIIDGKRVILASMGDHGFDGTTAAFWVIFEGDSSFSHDRAIYTVTIPAPGAAGLVFSCTMLALGRGRRTASGGQRAAGGGWGP